MSRLVFIGTGAGGFRGSSRHKAGVYLDGILLDCSAGTAERLEDLDLLDRVDNILITHLHSDHISGVFDLAVSMVVSRRNRPLHVYAPPGLARILDEYSKAGNKLGDPENGFELKIGSSESLDLQLPGHRVRSFMLDHVIPNTGYLIETDGYALFYTGDTRQPVDLQIRPDYIIHEATFTEDFRQLAALSGHSTARQAAEFASRCSAKRLFLTHVENRTSPPEAKLREALGFFDQTALPDDLSEFRL